MPDQKWGGGGVGWGVGWVGWGGGGGGGLTAYLLPPASWSHVGPHVSRDVWRYVPDPGYGTAGQGPRGS